MNKPLLVTGPDISVRSAFALAQEIFPQRRIELLQTPVEDYYRFDLTGLAGFSAEEWEVAVAVNEFFINDVRRAFHEAIIALGYHEVSLISPCASVDESVEIGEGAILYAGVFVGAGSHIGHHAVLRPNVFVGEEVEIGNYVTLEANVAIRELSYIGHFTTVCANSSLLRSTRVGEHCYLNLMRQYSGVIQDATFYSPIFENPIRFFSSSKVVT
ncbi:MAG: hypothetical protein LBF51_06105 [Zoogloeaceae bacterium]|jgi:acetyltransferase-like isoleucine patch superfamily enzyme|nr:hypothetical protein [Zoogloeaceae bacterium]